MVQSVQTSGARPAKRPATVLAAILLGLTITLLAVDAFVSLWSGAYLNLGSGVWLALAADLRDGTFYRPVWDGTEYGGTRYFPVLFALVAGLMALGVPADAAGHLVSVGGLAALTGAVAAFLSRLSVPPHLTALGTALAVAPYFVHETAFAIRSEPLAAAFAVGGLALVVPLERAGPSMARLSGAAALFVLAFGTKMTCIYGPLAAVTALVLAGARAGAGRLAVLTSAGALIFLSAVHLLSGGRALESFRACALAGSTPSSLLLGAFSTRPLVLISTSHLLTAVGLLVAVAFIASPVRWRLPALYFGFAAAVTAVVFASPGTILGSQIVEVYTAAAVFLTAATAAGTRRVRAAGVAAMMVLIAWSAAQNISRIALLLEGDARRAPDQRAAVTAVVRTCGEPILSESPLVPILAGHRPVLLDPFAFHVVSLNRPEVARDLEARLNAREFTCAVLEHDPTTSRGRAWYRNVNLTEAVIDTLLEHYVYAGTIGGQRFYERRTD